MYLRDKLASQIEQRESRLARLEAMERADRLRRLEAADRRSEQPLRRSKSRDAASTDCHYERVFQTVEEKEAALRRRRVIEETRPLPPKPVDVSDQDSQEKKGRRSSSNHDQIGCSKTA